MNTLNDLHAVILSALEISHDQDISDASGPGDLPGWDSFGWIVIMNAVEQHYSIELPLSALAEIRTVGELRLLVSQVKGVEEDT